MSDEAPICAITVDIEGSDEPAWTIYFRDKAESDEFVRRAMAHPKVDVVTIFEACWHTADSAFEGVEEMIAETATDTRTWHERTGRLA